MVRALESFLQALKVLRHPVLLIKAVVWSYVFWLWHGLSFWLGFKAFGIDVGFAAAVFTEAVVGFAVAIPAAPGFFGTFQAGADFALSGVYGVCRAVSAGLRVRIPSRGVLPDYDHRIVLRVEHRILGQGFTWGRWERARPRQRGEE